MNQESAQPKILQRILQTGDEVARIIYAKKPPKIGITIQDELIITQQLEPM